MQKALMPSCVTHFPPREMALLGLAEFSLSFGAIYAMIWTTGGETGLHSLGNGGLSLPAMLALIIGAFAFGAGLYRRDERRSPKQLLTATGFAATLAFTVMLFLTDSAKHGSTGTIALHTAKVLAAWLVTMTLIRLAYGASTGRPAMSRRVLWLGDADQFSTFRLRLRSRRGRGFELIAPEAPTVSWLWLRQQRVWGVVIAPEFEAAAMEPLLECKRRGIRILSRAAFHEAHLGRIDLDMLSVTDWLTSKGRGANRIAAAARRLCDIVIGTIMLILAVPLMAITALAIKCDSPGPVFYRQRRVGAFGKTFTLLKFRSMTADAEAGGAPRWAQKHDPRVTVVGRFIRVSRIDELPQLANVLRGDMSLIGPRPERPHFVEQLTRSIPFYQQRTSVKPGLTGWAQVNFPYGASIEDAREKLAYDLYYVKNRTVWLDAMILLSTVRVVLSGEGAR